MISLQSILSDIEARAKFVVIDELARLEKAGKGWANLIRFVQKNLSLIITILDQVIDKFGFSRKFLYLPQEYPQA